MAKAVATVGVSVVARTKNFRRGMKRAQSSLKRFRAGVVKTIKRTAKFGAVLAGVAAGAGAIWVKRTMDSIDATAKWADKLGIATEQLIAFQHAAKLSGVNVNTFNMGLQRMTRRMAEAAMGTGEAKAALLELGLNAKDLAAKGPGASLMAIADAMARVKNQSDRVRLSFKLFDSEGVALVNVLRLGSKGLRAMEKEARELGITFNRIDAAQVEAANNALVRMRAAFQGIANTVTIKLAPLIEVVAKKVTDFAKWMRGNAATFLEKAIRGLGTFAAKAAMAFVDLRIRWLRFSGTMFSDLHSLFEILSGLPGKLGEAFGLMQANASRIGQVQFFKADLLERQIVGIGDKVRTIFDGIAKDSRKAAEAFVKELGGKDVLFGGVRGMRQSLRRFQAAMHGVLGATAKQQLTNVALGFLGLGPGGLLTKLAGVKPKTGGVASASFREVDLSRVAIGPGNKRTDKAQRVEDPETKRSANLLAKIHEKIATPGLG